jgi:hypothetical protein
VSPGQIRAYSQNCVNGHAWLKITTTERPDAICPYCAATLIQTTIAWTHTLEREDLNGSGQNPPG